MARRKTYGERMAEWEAEKDRKDWEHQYDQAVVRRDYQYLEQLIVDGLCEGYELPYTDDIRLQEIIQKHSK